MNRSRVLVALLLLLSACGARSDRDPFTDSRIPPNLGPADWPPEGWTWGLIQVPGAPPQRYGAAAPADEPLVAQALKLPGYGGLAEEDFPAGGALIGRRIQVWALDGVGQGGSGRVADPRDLGHVASFEDDVQGVREMARQVIRPDSGAPLVAVADGTAAPVLLRAVQEGLPEAAAIMLTEPRMSAPTHPLARPSSPEAALWVRWLHLDRRRAPGESGWRRAAPNLPEGSLAYLRHAWQTANPDLRMGGPSLGWFGAFDALVGEVRATGYAGVRLPALVLADPAAPAAQRAEAARLCAALPHCTLILTPEADWPGREGDFIIGVAQARADPQESAGLPNPGHGR